MRTRQEEWDMAKFQGTADMIAINEKASEILSWIQDAVGDLSSDVNFLDDKWTKKVKAAKRSGVRDIQGWLADEYYNDVDTLQDLCGDRIFDAASQLSPGPYDKAKHDVAFVAIAEEMKKHAHTALVTALDKLIERKK